LSYRIQFHISPVHTSTSCLLGSEQPTAQPSQRRCWETRDWSCLRQEDGYKYKKRFHFKHQ